MTRLQAVVTGFSRAVLVLAVGLMGFALFAPGDDEASRYAALRPGQPVRLVVPSVQVRSAVDPVTVSTSGVLAPPEDVRRVGWWEASARPGSGRGQTVVTGHSVHTGGGVLDRLADVRRGAVVDLVTGQGRMRYRVTGVRMLPKDRLAARSQALFGQDRGAGRLVLVSCAGWDGSAYEKNVVVLADPLGQPVARTAATTR